MQHKIAAQLYTVREQLAQDFPRVLREISKMGYDGVQLAGLHGYKPETIKQVLAETGLQMAGMHVSLEELRENLEDVISQAKLFETRDIICPWLGPEWRNEHGYRQLKEILNTIARKLMPHNLRLSYHNHDFEFHTKIDNRLAITYLLEPSADNKILAELDVYWIKKGGEDPLTFIQPYAGRMPILHLKDMSKDESHTFTEVGNGLIDFAPILEWGETSGVEWYVVEQDICPQDPLDSLRISLTNLQQLIG